MLTVFKFIKNDLKIDVSRHKHFSNVKYGIVFANINWRWGVLLLTYRKHIEPSGCR